MGAGQEGTGCPGWLGEWTCVFMNKKICRESVEHCFRAVS